MTFWGPQEIERTGIPYSPFNKSEKITKICDWTSTLELKEPIHSRENSFSTIDRQTILLRKSAIRSLRPSQKKPQQQQQKRTVRYADPKPKPREPSIKVKPTWKIIDTLEFSRMSNLYYDPDNVQDLAVCGTLSYYDKQFDRVNVKTEKTLKPATLNTLDPTASDDSTLLSFPEEDEASVVTTDSVLAALMCCTRSIYSWDIIVTKKGSRLVFDKRPGGSLDFVTVNENAAEPPIETVDKDQNINSHEALSFEATSINKSFCEQVLSSEKVDLGSQPSFAADQTDIVSKAYRYRKWKLDGVNLYMRTSVSCIQQGKNTVQLADFDPIEDALLVNNYALNEFDYRAVGAGGALDWRKKLDSQRGAVIATEMKNNSHKLAKWTVQSIFAGVNLMRIGFCSRQSTKDRKRHHILGTSTYKPEDFIEQIQFDIGNGWGIVKATIDILQKLGDGKYVLLKDPERPVLLLYQVGQNLAEELK